MLCVWNNRDKNHNVIVVTVYLFYQVARVVNKWNRVAQQRGHALPTEAQPRRANGASALNQVT